MPCSLSSSVALLLGEIDKCTHRLFLKKCNAQQLLFETLFDIMCIFGSIGPKSEKTFPFLSAFQYANIPLNHLLPA